MTTHAVVADVMQTPDRHTFQHLPDTVIGIDERGAITSVSPRASPAGQATLAAAERSTVLPPGTVVLPGLIDLHIHAPQWPQLGTGLDLPLERWLFDHTFPLEARYGDPAFAAAVWPDLVRTLLRHGTTTAVYFGTNDEAATLTLAAECLRQGQRAFVGRVAMDHPEGTPAWYRDATAADGVAASARSIEAIRALDAGRDLVRPIITPRFTPACTDALLAGLGALARDTGVTIQTHCSESDWAHTYALERFGTTDATALHRFGLLGAGTVLAHANHLTDPDADLLVAHRAGIAHCPLSNAYFANAVLPVRRLLDRGVRIGLGTDVAGGAAPGLLRQCHDAVTASRVLEDGTDPRQAAPDRGRADSRIDIVTAFWMATRGAADLLGLPIGTLEPGRRFDAIAVGTVGDRRGASALRVWPGIDDPARVFEKIVRLATADDITHTWVDGRRRAAAT